MPSAELAATSSNGFASRAADLVEQLQEVMRGELDLLVAPLRRAVYARDQTGAMDAAEVAVHERVTRLRLSRRAFGEAEVPLGVLLPAVGVEEAVLGLGPRLHVSPVGVQDVLARLDALAAVSDGGGVDGVGGDGDQNR